MPKLPQWSAWAGWGRVGILRMVSVRNFGNSGAGSHAAQEELSWGLEEELQKEMVDDGSRICRRMSMVS